MAVSASLAGKVVLWTFYLVILYFCCIAAYQIRIYAITNYGYVIHEFDPWFNFRATKYLAEHGWHAFFHWFDYKVWYPLGRPVGTTIYPGMQITSVAIWRLLPYVMKAPLSLNDVCCLVPAWFGVSATMALGAFTAECTGTWSAGVASAAIMAIIPAHIMRSVAGGYDNESIALTAMCGTFYCWVRSLRADAHVSDGRATRDCYTFGVLTGLAYVYMVAAWGGYVFVLNMIGVHAAALVMLGRYSSKLHRAYSLFFVIGTLGATRVPPVNLAPLKSLEQMGPLLVFIVMQMLEYVEVQRRRKKLSFKQVLLLRLKVAVPCGLVLLMLAAALYPTGYFGPLSARVRSLFVKHTRTGNPLVDSVAEHQPANEQAYQHYLSHIYSIAPIGFGLSLLRWTDANLFLVLYGAVAYYFSNKMARLIILLGPVASALGGTAIGAAFDQLILRSIQRAMGWVVGVPVEEETEAPAGESAKVRRRKEAVKHKIDGLDRAKAVADMTVRTVDKVYNHPFSLAIRLALGLWLVYASVPTALDFYDYSHKLAESLSQPQIMFKAKLYNGQEVMVDDYREAYWWLRDHTPQDARVMAWWDYGYQITGIGERTTIADGNTWNHEHIATLGLILSAPEHKAHSIARHLADYVLVWAGGGGDDLAKSPHMARIGNSVYRDICPGDPTCSQFGFYQGGVPTPMMEQALLYKLVSYGRKDVPVNESLFQHVFTSKYGKVRIFKIRRVSLKSKKWVADPANRLCDAPGSWYCTGQYPPALAPLISRRKNFAQLEDFNTGRSKEDEEYDREYHERMSGKRSPAPAGPPPSPIKYVGCVGAEALLGEDRVYEGGGYGSSAEMGAAFAREFGMRYVALARVDEDGHAFAFSTLPKKSLMLDDDGCHTPCADDDRMACGCADELCGGLGAAPGEEHVRRWALYKVGAPPKKKRSSKDEV